MTVKIGLPRQLVKNSKVGGGKGGMYFQGWGRWTQSTGRSDVVGNKKKTKKKTAMTIYKKKQGFLKRA